MYDLLNTKMHVDYSDFALNKGLFADNYKSEPYKKSNHPNKNDFEEFGRRIGVSENRIEKLIAPYLEKQPFMELLIGRSFLTDVNKRGYLMMYQTKRNYLMEE
jgi:serine/threonine-protein kinase HipA